MASISTTVEVSVEQYSEHVPDDVDGDTIEIDVEAFDDTCYIKFPRFDRRGTNDFCMSAMDIFHALIRVTDRSEIEVDPVLRRMGVLGDGPFGADSNVSTRIIGDVTEADIAHLKAFETFTSTIAGFQYDEYWNGYRDGAANNGGSHSWPDIAWTAFESRWDGDKDLLLEIGEWFVQNGYAVCSRSRALFPIPEWSTPTGSYVATISDVYDGTCPTCGADKDEHWECIESSNRTRVPNKYKCNECGVVEKGITTG